MRKTTRTIRVGNVPVGGDAPVSIQSMTNTKTSDIPATAAQIQALQAAGCEIVRVAVPDEAAARAIYDIKQQIDLPLVADIHFDYRLALLSAEAGADKIRINPGNIGGEDRVRQVAGACKARGIPIRIGVNGGSLEKEILARHGNPTAEAMVESAFFHISLLEKFDFYDICVSLKASSVPEMVAANRLFSERSDIPLHLGVTEAGTEQMGLLKSAAGIGGLLCMGIGDTIRVSLTAPPVREIYAADSLLRAVGLRQKGLNLISCPSCGRCAVDLITLAEAVEKRFSALKMPLTIAVMGCAVNGPGEARHADVGIACGDGKGLLFMSGVVVDRPPADELLNALAQKVFELTGERL